MKKVKKIIAIDGRKPQGKAPIEIRGKVIHRVNGKVIKVQHNAINAGLLAYLASSMDTVVDKAINDLMTAAGVAPGGAQDAKDGIALYDGTGEEWVTFETTVGAPVETHGRRWVGNITVAQAREVQQLAIGHSYEAGTPPFDTTFATQTFAGIALAVGANYEVEWELYLDEPAS